MNRDYLTEMGIQRWVERSVPSEEPAPVKEPMASGATGNSEAEAVENEWQALKADVSVCQLCSLSRTRTRTVFGVGDEHARWMFIGEAPGVEEDRQGLPFVGRAGKLLTAIIESIGMTRDEVFIANVLKCRPPGNRDPMGEEVTQCSGYLLAQIRHVRPEIIIALGAFAAHALLRTAEPIGRLRGRVHSYGDDEIPLVATYHPAYLLRSPLEKRKVWEDIQLALRAGTGEK